MDVVNHVFTFCGISAFDSHAAHSLRSWDIGWSLSYMVVLSERICFGFVFVLSYSVWFNKHFPSVRQAGIKGKHMTTLIVIRALHLCLHKT